MMDIRKTILTLRNRPNHSVRLFALILVFLAGACVDRIDLDTDIGTEFPVAVEGFITDQPGPYRVEISRSFDMESKQTMKISISAKKVIISDDHGNSEELAEISQGVYQTSSPGIQGQAGYAYKLHVQLLDGRVYESIPDTLKSSGSIDRVYHSFREDKDANGASYYGFDVLFDANTGNSSNYFLWKFEGTFQVDTNPELHMKSCGEAPCPDPRPCSSYVVGADGRLEYAKLCECCTCWVNFFNDTPVVSDNQLVSNGQFTKIKSTYIPITEWTFMYKVRAEVKQFTLSHQAFNFWRAVQAQKNATESLFQPITGKVQGNFIQISGEPGIMEGLFYASGVSSKAIFITRSDVPNEGVIPPQVLPYPESCMSLFPYSTTEKPAYWE